MAGRGLLPPRPRLLSACVQEPALAEALAAYALARLSPEERDQLAQTDAGQFLKKLTEGFRSFAEGPRWLCRAVVACYLMTVRALGHSRRPVPKPDQARDRARQVVNHLSYKSRRMKLGALVVACRAHALREAGMPRGYIARELYPRSGRAGLRRVSRGLKRVRALLDNLPQFDPEHHARQCLECRSAGSVAQMCAKARAYADQDQVYRRELVVRDGLDEGRVTAR